MFGLLVPLKCRNFAKLTMITKLPASVGAIKATTSLSGVTLELPRFGMYKLEKWCEH